MTLKENPVTLYQMFDAAFPPANPFPGCHAVAGYIGGNTPHVWTLEEWQRFGRLRQLPIWVASPSEGPGTQAMNAAAAAISLGWRPHLEHRRAIVLDMETSTDAAFVTAFADELHHDGFSCWPYGSASTIYSDPSADGYWVADWDLVATLEQFPKIMAHQFQAEIPLGQTTVDLSVLSGEGLLHLGRGPRHAA
jgi:hypothetical protein